MKNWTRGVPAGMVLLLAACALTMTVGAVPLAAQDTFPCVADDKMETDIASGAELAEFTCFFKRFEGKEVIHFKVGVKNTGSIPQRFRINIFLDNGKAVGGLIPRKTKKGLIEPGKTGTFVYPVNGMTEKPQSILLKIGTSS